MQNQINQNTSKVKKKLSDAFYIGLFCFGLLVMACVLLMTVFRKSSSADDAEKMAVEVLKMKTGEPEDFKLLEISDMDSVFQNRYCPDHEVYDLSQRYLDHYLTMIDFNEDSLDEEKEDEGMLDDFNRISRASETIDLFNELLKKPQGDFCGWRLRIKYSCLDENKKTKTSEAWLIFDRSRKHVLNSFEFPIL